MALASIICACGARLDTTGRSMLDEIECAQCGLRTMITPKKLKDAERATDRLVPSDATGAASIIPPHRSGHRQRFPFVRSDSPKRAMIRSCLLAFQHCSRITSHETLWEAVAHFLSCGRCMSFGSHDIGLHDEQLHPFLESLATELTADESRIAEADTLEGFVRINASLIAEIFETSIKRGSITIEQAQAFAAIRGLRIESTSTGPLVAPPRPRPEIPGKETVSTPKPGAAPPRPKIDVFEEEEPTVERPDGMPPDLAAQLVELEEWAQANKADARRDVVAFWLFKAPAMFASASSGVFALYDLQAVGAIMGAVATLSILVDSVHPRGMLRNTHLRAYHDLRLLLTGMVSSWRTRSQSADPRNIAKRIIKDAEAERQRIANYIRDAETALKPTVDQPQK